jgi:putative NIF3 family GTP cyclohydrolase 1 type 2
MTIRELVELIEQQVPGGLPPQTSDTFKSGDPSQLVRGVVITFMATLQVLERAVELGANLVITHEPTFYNNTDDPKVTAWLDGDPTYSAKKNLIQKRGITIWRFHDGCHKQKPDSILAGLIEKLGWKFDPASGRETVFVIEPQTAKSLAQFCKERLGIQRVRVAGDLDTVCTRVGILVGAWGGRPQIQLFQEANVDVVLCGESPEWETCEYVRDASHLMRKKALIVLGHANSEESGMEWISNWLRPMISRNIPITYLPAGDPFQYI